MLELSESQEGKYEETEGGWVGGGLSRCWRLGTLVFHVIRASEGLRSVAEVVPYKLRLAEMPCSAALAVLGAKFWVLVS